MTSDQPSRELAEAARNLRAARRRLDAAMAAARQAAVNAHSHGRPETEVARKLGVNRMTVRRWLGEERTQPVIGRGQFEKAPPEVSALVPPYRRAVRRREPIPGVDFWDDNLT